MRFLGVPIAIASNNGKPISILFNEIRHENPLKVAHLLRKISILFNEIRVKF